MEPRSRVCDVPSHAYVAPRVPAKRTHVLNIVHRINAKPLRNQALEFDGV